MTLKIAHKSQDTLLVLHAKDQSYANQTDRITFLRESIFPLTSPQSDKLGRTIQLWSLPQAQVIGIIKNADGSVYQLPAGSISNGLNPSDNNVTLYNRLLTDENANWDLVLEKANKLSVWPHLEASGWPEAIPKRNGDLPGLTRLARGKTQEQMCAWFYTNGYRVNLAKHDARLVMHLNGTHICDVKATDHETIQNLLRQKAVVAQVKFEEPSKDERKANFAGRGLVFSHPKDKSNSTFHVDYTKHNIKEPGSKGTPEHEGGYHIDVRSKYIVNKKKISTHETYSASRDARLSYTTSKKVNRLTDSTAPFKLLACPSVLNSFKRVIQQTQLTKSYNSTHPQNSISAKAGGNNDIGGVSCSTDYIQGLFSKPEDLFINEHFFFLPSLDGIIPFSNEELQQILRELAIGIYEHSAIPFFSLHFNQEADLFPVIHPAYQNTLVGRVIAMLDYIMKGYINGGTFKEDFVDQWHKNRKWPDNEKTAFEQMIDFHDYCQNELTGDDKVYMSVRQHETHTVELLEMLVGKDVISLEEGEILKDYSEFFNSFRIISTQKSFQKEGNLLLLHPDFEVEYTIAPTEKYRQHLNHHIRDSKKKPPSYANLEAVFELFKYKIHDHLTKFPLCKQYFSMLHVISYISGYYSTLKKHNKVPCFTQIAPISDKGCPTLFPNLPLRKLRKTTLRLNIAEALRGFDQTLLKNYLISDLPCTSVILHFSEVLKSNALAHSDSSTRVALSQLFDTNKGIALNLQRDFKKLAEVVLSKIATNFIDYSSSQKLQEIGDVINKMICDCSERIFDHHNFKILLEKLKKSVNEFNKNKSLSHAAVVGQLFSEMVSFGYGNTDGHTVLIDVLILWLNQIAEANLDLTNYTEGFLSSNAYKNIVHDSLIDFTKINLNMLVHPMDQSPSETKIGKRMVGGCALRLNRKKVESSSSVQRLYIDLLPMMSHLPEETWQSVVDETHLGQSGSFFKLSIEDSTSNSDYSWMQEAFFVRGTLEEQLGYLAIHFAARENSIEKLSQLTNSSTINLKAKNGETPLIVAIQQGLIKNVAYLIREGATNSYLTTGYHALHCALHHGHVDIAYLLLKKKICSQIEINDCAEEGGTPLILATKIGDLSLIKALISCGADHTVQTKNGKTALDVALSLKNKPIAAYLLSLGKPSAYVIEHAAAQGSREMMELVAQSEGFSRFHNQFQETPLMIAVRHGNIETARFLLQDKSNLNLININGFSALDLAVENGFFEFALEMIDLGLQKISFNHLKSLIKLNYHQGLNQLFEKSSLTSQEIQSLADTAAKAGNYLALTTLLIPKGADLKKIQGEQRWQIAHYLAKSDAIFLFKKVMRDERDLIMRDGEGKTLAYIAAENGSLRVLKFLLDKPEKPLFNQHHQKHLLYGALLSEKIECVQMILALDSAQINRPLDHLETSSLHLAARLGNKQLVKWLIERGAQSNLKDANGLTPLYFALCAGASKIAEILLEKNINVEPCDFYAAADQQNLLFFQKIASLFSVDHLSDNKNTALMLAVLDKNEKAGLKLILAGANPHAICENSWTPLLLAAKNGLIKIILSIPTAKLFSHDRVDKKNALEWACENGQTTAALILSGAGYETTNHYQNATIGQVLGKFYPFAGLVEQLFCAIKENIHSETFKLVKKLPYNERLTFKQGSLLSATPLQLALHHQIAISQQEIEELVSLGLDPNLEDSNGNTLGHLMAKQNLDPTSIKGLNFAKVNHMKQTALHIAAGSSSLKNLEAYTQGSIKEIFSQDIFGQTPLFYALTERKHENVELLAKLGSDLNHKDNKRETPLYFAVKRDDFTGVETLISFNASVNQYATLKRIYPIQAAIGASQSELFLYLISQGARSEFAQSNGKTVAHIASARGNLEMLKLVSAQGVTLKNGDKLGRQPIHVAASEGHNSIIDELIDRQGVLVDTKVTSFNNEILKKEITPLFFAAFKSQSETVQNLLERKANTDDLNETTSVLSAASNSPSVMEILKKYTLTENPHALHKAMRFACISDNPTTLKMLLSCGVSVNSTILDKNALIHFASRFGAVQCTALLIELEANCFLEGEQRKTPLELSASNKNAEQFRLLLEHCLWDHKFHIDQMNAKGETFVHIAVQAGNLAHLAHLAYFNADLNLQDEQGKCALEYAISLNHKEIIKFLIACGADVSKISLPEDIAKILLAGSSSDSLLHKALLLNEPYAIHLLSLLQDVNQSNEEGVTPLHRAAASGVEKNVYHLLKEGADVNAEDRRGRTALTIACLENPNLKVAEVLLSCGANPLIQNNQGDSLVKQLKIANSSDCSAFLKLCAAYTKKSGGNSLV